MLANRERAQVAALIGSDLRGLDRFVPRLDQLLQRQVRYDVFVSSDARSIACAKKHHLLPRLSVRWFGESPDTDAAILRAFGPLKAGVSPHHLHQWWRLADAWRAMEQHEREQGYNYAVVLRLRTDMRLPAPLFIDVAQLLAKPLDLVMRGDWIFWGARPAVQVALEYVAVLPAFHRAGQRTYMQLPYRHLIAVGAQGLSAGLLGWLKFPKQSAVRPFGFSPACVANAACVVAHAKEHLVALETFHASGEADKMRTTDLTSARDTWWRWDGIPDNEKYFLYHVLNRSLVPRSMIELQNGHVPPEQRVTFLGKTNGLLLVCCARPVPTCTVLRTIKVLTICYRACRVCVCVCVCVSLSDIT